MCDNQSEMSTETSQDPSKKIQHRLLIKSVFRGSSRSLSRWLPFGRYPHPIRGVLFDAGLRVTNIDNKPFSGALIHSFEIISKVSGVRWETEKQVAAKVMNPGESDTYWLEEQLLLSFDGPVMVSCHLEPIDERTQIITHQGSVDRPAKCPEGSNYWLDGEYIEEKLAVLQARTNQLILVLTVLTFLQGVWGLDTIGSSLLQAIRSLLELLLSRLPQA